MFQTPDLAPLAGSAARRDKPFGFYDATVDGGWQVPGEPYARATEEDAGRFDWWRARMLGGRTNHWGRISLRNGPYDFKPHSRDGSRLRLADRLRGRGAVLRQGRDADRRLRQQRGTGEHARIPHRAACCRRPSRWSATCLVAQRAKPLGIPVIPGHRAVLTQPLDYAANAAHACIPATRRRRRSSRRTCAIARPASGRHRAAAAARSAPTTSRRPCTCRRRSPAGNLDITHRRDGLRGHARARRTRERRELHRPNDRQAAARRARAS